MSKIYFFTGEETYLLHQEVLKRKSNFRGKYGSENVLSLWIGEYSANAIIEQITNTGLFSSDKLIIIDGIPGETTSPAWTSDLEEKVMQMWWSINPDYFIIFISSKPDKRKKAYKFFSDPAHCQVKVFDPLKWVALAKHSEQNIRDYLNDEHKSIKIDKEIITLLLERSQENLWTINNEAQKIAQSINAGKTLSYEHAASIISGQAQDTMFAFLDTIIMKQKDIYTIIDNIRHENKAIQEILGWLIWGLKIVISYASIIAQDKWASSIAWLLGVAPFTIAKYKSYSDFLSIHTNDFLWLYNDILDFDFQFKSGNSEEQSFRPLLITSLQKHHLLSIH